MITPKKVTKSKLLVAAQDWRAAKDLLSKTKTYENAVEHQKAARVLKDSIRASFFKVVGV